MKTPNENLLQVYSSGHLGQVSAWQIGLFWALENELNLVT